MAAARCLGARNPLVAAPMTEAAPILFAGVLCGPGATQRQTRAAHQMSMNGDLDLARSE